MASLLNRIVFIPTNEQYIYKWFEDIYNHSNYDWNTNTHSAYLIDISQSKNVKDKTDTQEINNISEPIKITKIFKLGEIINIKNYYFYNPYFIIIKSIDYDRHNIEFKNDSLYIAKDKIKTNTDLIHIIESAFNGVSVGISGFVNSLIYNSYKPFFIEPQKIYLIIITNNNSIIDPQILKCINKFKNSYDNEKIHEYILDYTKIKLNSFINDKISEIKCIKNAHWNILLLGFDMNPKNWIKTYEKINSSIYNLDEEQSIFRPVAAIINSKLKYTLLNIYKAVEDDGLYDTNNRMPLSEGQIILNLNINDIIIVKDMLNIITNVKEYDYTKLQFKSLEILIAKYLLSNPKIDDSNNCIIKNVYDDYINYIITNTDKMCWAMHKDNFMCSHPYMIPNATQPTFYWNIYLLISAFITTTKDLQWTVPHYVQLIIKNYYGYNKY